MKSKKIELSNVHRIMSKTMMKSWANIPQFNLETKVNFENIINARKEDGKKYSYTAVMVKVLSNIILEHPFLNSSWQNDHIVQYDQANIGIAMDTTRGLLVPVIKNANNKSLIEINNELEALKKAGIEGKIGPEKFEEGTFTITNLGMYNVNSFTPIVKPPESAILAVSKIFEEAIINKNNELNTARFIRLVLAADHRVLDGATAAKFITELAQKLEETENLLNI